MKLKTRIVELSLSILMITSIITYLILARKYNISEYTLSLYSVYPQYLWWIIIFVLAGSIWSVIYLAINQRKFNLISLYPIVVTNLIIFLLPILSGYPFYGRDDPVTHLGYVRDILLLGHFTKYDLYPLSHILVAVLSIFLNINATIILPVVPPIFYLLYIAGIFIFSKKVAVTIRQRLLVILFSILLPIGVYSPEFYPIGLAIMMLPMALYIIIPSEGDIKPQNEYLVGILTFTLVFLHPAMPFFLIPILLTYILILRAFYRKEKDQIKYIKYRNILSKRVVLLFVVFMAWFSSLPEFAHRISYLVERLNSDTAFSYVTEYQTKAKKAQLGIHELYKLLFKIYGPTLIYLVFYLLVLYWIYKKFTSQRTLDKNETFFVIFSMFFIGISSFLFIGGIPTFGYPLRYLKIGMIGVAILNGLVLSEKIFTPSRRSVSFSITIMLIFSSTLAVLSFYPSPYIKMPDHGVSYAEFVGSVWLSRNIEIDTPIVPIVNELSWRMREVTYGYSTGIKGRHIRPSPHFEYLSEYSSSCVFNRGAIAITKFDKLYYTKLWPIQGSFNRNDFRKIKINYGVINIYINRDFEGYLLQPRKC